MHDSALRVILIGGPSNTGKTTLAGALSARLGWPSTSTDRLGRHPGRPWGTVPPHVVEHYLSLSPDALFEAVMRHYASMWPGVREIIAAHAAGPAAEGLILEGSALRPELVAELELPGVGAIWLTASDAFLRERIYRASGYAQAPDRDRILIDKFLGRQRRYKQSMLLATARLGLPAIDVEASPSLEHLTDKALSRLGLAAPSHT